MESIKKIFKFRLLDNTLYFKIIFTLWALLHSVSFGQHITPYFSIILIGWGGLLVIRTLFLKDFNYKNFYSIISMIFVVGYSITILLNRDSNFIGNTKSLIWMVILLVILFLGDKDKTSSDVIDDIKKICTAITIPSFIITGIGLLTFFFDINFRVIKGDGSGVPQGYYAARLWGIYADPNEACTVALIAIISSIVVMYLVRGKSRNITLVFNGINILVQYLFVVLCASRGGAVGFIFLLIGCFYILLKTLLNKKISSSLVTTISSLLIAIILTTSIISMFEETRKTIAYVPRYILSLSTPKNPNGDGETEEELPDITTERPDNKDSNGRMELWESGFKLSTESPIFGHGDRNVNVRAKVSMPESRLSRQHVHSSYLHLLISGGVVALLLMFVLIATVAWKAVVRILSCKKYDKTYYIYSLMSILCGTLLVTSVFLTELFFQNSFTTVVFWMALGYLVTLENRYKEIK